MTKFYTLCFMILSLFYTSIYAESHHPQEFLQSIAGTKDEGKHIYSHYCATCHAQTPLINLGAPKIADEKEWSLRLKQGMDLLFKHTDEGLNAMPPRGGCFECTDKQLMLAIITMLPKKEQKYPLKSTKSK